ncbi:LysR family transcriptional regulator [Peredibacter sp. HCB2-198]|uniref:LysR family transcriptional regulator n=1 Tax=Peredibacter sp. HCB2-198 TaxID=3383025 RepID=UPI0038B4D8D4
MQTIDLNEILVFIKVVQTGSFTHAAKHLGMPISTVSARVSSLEKRLGVTLLQRTTRQLKLTQAGHSYYEQSLRGLEEIQKAETDVTSNLAEPQGDLRITAPIFLANTLMPKVICESMKKYPKIKIELILQDRAVDLIAEGVDLAIRAGDLKDSTLIAKKLGIVHFSAFATSGYLKNKGPINHPKDLQEHVCLQFAPLGRHEWSFSNGKSRVNVPLKGKLVIDDLSMIKSLALSGNGVALLPTYICEEEVKKGRLVPLLTEWKSHSRAIHFVHPPQKFPSPKLKAFLELASDQIKEQLS